jgi:hypothetical protein
MQTQVIVLTATIFIIVNSFVHALGSGEACVFYRPLSILSVNVGHVGWGWQINGTGTYVYGATEGQAGASNIPKGQPNGFWEEQGSNEVMKNAFKSRDYVSYNCEGVENINVSAAYTTASETKVAGYNILSNNCLDHTIAILTAYNAKGLPSDNTFPTPKDWFEELGIEGNNIGGNWSPKSIDL